VAYWIHSLLAYPPASRVPVPCLTSMTAAAVRYVDSAGEMGLGEKGQWVRDHRCLLMLVGDGSWPGQGQLPGQPRRVAASLCGVSYDDDVMTVYWV